MLQELLVSASHRLPVSPPSPSGFNHQDHQLWTRTSNLNSLFQVLEDPLQSQRLKYAFESEKGLLGASDNKEKAVLFYCKYAPELLLLFLSFDAPEQQCGQQALLPVCEVPGHVGSEVSTCTSI